MQPHKNYSDGVRLNSWTVANNSKKRQRNSPEFINKTYKHTKINIYWLGDQIPTINRFQELENEQHDSDTESTQPEKQIKPPPIFVDSVSNIQPLSKLPNETIHQDYEIKVLSTKQIKLQPKSTKAYTIIVKALQQRNTEFHTYKPKYERNFRVVLRTHAPINQH